MKNLTSIQEIYSEQQSKIDAEMKLLEKRQNKVLNTTETFLTDLIIQDSDIQLKDVLEQFGWNVHQKQGFIIKLLSNPNIHESILTQEEALQVLSCSPKYSNKKVYQNIEMLFQKLNREDKLKFTLFCLNDLLVRRFDFAAEWIENEFGIGFNNIFNQSNISICGYYLELQQSGVRITLLKNDSDGALKVAQQINNLLETGCYKNDSFDIFERSLGKLYFYRLRIQKNEDGTLTPELMKDDIVEYTSEKEGFYDQLVDVLDYISKHHYYQ